MTPLDKEVDAFMTSQGFEYYIPKYTPRSASWRGHGISFTQEQATFFYTAFKTQREQIFNTVREMKNEMSYELCKLVDNDVDHELEPTDVVSKFEDIRNRQSSEMKELEAQLNQKAPEGAN